MSLKSTQKPLLFAILWLLITSILLCLPGTEFPTITWLNKIWFDKWVHLGLFFLLVLLWCAALKNEKDEPKILKKKFLWITIISIVYGVVMEFVQHNFIPFRSFDAWDIAADGLGSLGGYFLATYWYLKK